MPLFDPNRTDFAPYGFTCVSWLPERMKRPDRHNEIELNLLLDGELVYLFGGRTVILRAGELGVFWASVPHQIVSFSGRAPYFVATIPLPWFLACRLPSAMAQALLHGEFLRESLGERAQLDRALFQQWSDDLSRSGDVRAQIALREMEARLHRLALSATASPPEAEPLAWDSVGAARIERVASYIAQSYTSRLSVEGVASEVGLHPNYLMTLFRKAFGTTLLEYINRHRVTHAQRLLATTDDSVLKIALDSGFSSLSRFNAVFKAYSKCTPRAYRRTHRLSLP